MVCGAWIVSDHDDGLFRIAVQLFQDGQDLVGGLRVEVAGRLIGKNQGGIGDDCAGDGDALFLTAG